MIKLIFYVIQHVIQLINILNLKINNINIV